MRQAVRRQKTVVDAFPKTPASLAFKALASRACDWPVPHQPGGHLEFFIEKLLLNDSDESDKEF